MTVLLVDCDALCCSLSCACNLVIIISHNAVYYGLRLISANWSSVSSKRTRLCSFDLHWPIICFLIYSSINKQCAGCACIPGFKNHKTLEKPSRSGRAKQLILTVEILLQLIRPLIRTEKKKQVSLWIKPRQQRNMKNVSIIICQPLCLAESPQVMGQRTGQRWMDGLVDWCCNINLSLSVNKTRELIGDFTKGNSGDHLRGRWRVSSVKFLHVNISDELSWDQCIDVIMKKER